MQRYQLKITKDRKRVKVIRDPEVIDKELKSYKRSKYLRSMLNQVSQIDPDRIRKEEEEKKRKKEEQQKAEERKKRLEQLKSKEEQKTRFFQEFIFSNENKPVQIDLSKIREDSVPLSIAKEQIQRAYEDGMQDGQITARSSLKNEIEGYQEWIRRFDIITNDLKKEQIKSIEIIESTIIELAVSIAEQILNREILKDSLIVVNQVRKAIESVKSEIIFKIEVNPEAYNILQEVKSSLIEDYQLNDDIKIIANSDVPIGGCILNTSAGLLDGRVKNQLNKISEDLIEAEKRLFDTDEIQKNVDEFIENQTEKDELSLENKSMNTNIDEIDLDNVPISDLPDEYKDMLEDKNDFKKTPEIGDIPDNSPEIDYSKLDEDIENDKFYEDENNDEDDTNLDDLDRNFDDLFDS